MAGALDRELEPKAPERIRNAIMDPMLGASIHPTLKHTNPVKLIINTIRRPNVSESGAQISGAKQKLATNKKTEALATLGVVLKSSTMSTIIPEGAEDVKAVQSVSTPARMVR